jgi:hypothetical protein
MKIKRSTSGFLMACLIMAFTATMILIPKTPGYARASDVKVTGRRTSETSATRKRKRHKGKQAENQVCHDDSKSATYLEMNATLSADKKSVTMTPTLDQVEAVFDHAFEECFMEDLDIWPGYGSDMRSQQDVHDFPVADGTARLYLRPASNVAIQSYSVLMKNEGFIAADIYNGSDLIFTNDDLRGEIPSGHSAFLWVGRDEKGDPYVAVIDLAHFPDVKVPTVAGRDFHVMDGGGLEPLKTDKPRTDIAFARWSLAHTVSAKIHEGSWVDCDPGCCMSLGVMRGFDVRAKSAKARATKAPAPGAGTPMKEPR